MSRRRIEPVQLHGFRNAILASALAWVIVSLLTAGCTTRSSPASGADVIGRSSTTKTTVAAEGSGCTAAGGRRLVGDFLAAFNAGDQEKLQALWAPAGQGWEWFATDGPEPRIDVVARDRAGLGAYFARRHAQHEVIRLLSFQWNGTSGMLGNFEYTLDRHADDLRTTPYGGKGSAVCTSTPVTIGTWSMARNPVIGSATTAVR